MSWTISKKGVHAGLGVFLNKWTKIEWVKFDHWFLIPYTPWISPLEMVQLILNPSSELIRFIFYHTSWRTLDETPRWFVLLRGYLYGEKFTRHRHRANFWTFRHNTIFIQHYENVYMVYRYADISRLGSSEISRVGGIYRYNFWASFPCKRLLPVYFTWNWTIWNKII